MTAKAILRNYRQSPRKVRLVANLIKGKSVEKALVTLRFTTKRASDPIVDLVKSAQANAKNLDLDVDNLYIKEIAVNEGPIMYRRRARARGRAMPIRKRTSHVSIILEERPEKAAKKEEKAVSNKKEKTAKSKAKSESAK
jgi:large subunit ribosomal protein L22